MLEIPRIILNIISKNILIKKSSILQKTLLQWMITLLEYYNANH